MVKNTTGGSGNKKFARKFAAGNNKAGQRLRVSENEGELYAVATKNLGNNMFHAISIDGQTYLVHIRGKFSGRGRRDNTVAAGVWVLIGTREWSNGSGSTSKTGKQKLPECDLLEVYSEADKMRLMDSEDEYWHILENNDPTKINKEDSRQREEISWQTEKDEEKDKLLVAILSGTTEKISLLVAEEGQEQKCVKGIITEEERQKAIEVFIDDI